MDRRNIGERTGLMLTYPGILKTGRYIPQFSQYSVINYEVGNSLGMVAPNSETSPNGDNYIKAYWALLCASSDPKSTMSLRTAIFPRATQQTCLRRLSVLSFFPYCHRDHSMATRKYTSMAASKDRASPNHIHESFFRQTSRRWM